MKKFFGIFIDVFLITASICIAVILNNKFNIFISGMSTGIWIICLVLDIIELCYIPEYKPKRQFDSIEKKGRLSYFKLH